MAGVIWKEAVVRIPEDVTVEILKGLPVKSLLRFSCACKTWYSLISDPEFCNKLQQKRACVLICQRSETYSTVTIESLMNEKTSMLSATISFPWQQPDPRFNTKFLGSCNGLVSVNYGSPDLSGLILWNPSTRKYRILPSTSRARNFFNQNTCAGFGYDESVHDYKFVWMTFKHPESRPSVIEFDVFSLKSNTWRSYDHCPSSDIMLSSMNWFCKIGVHINGAIHWVTSCRVLYSNSIGILALDLASDKFILLEPPQEWSPRNCYHVVSLSGCLCLSVYCNKNEDSHIDLWMMKEYGVNSSWLKLVSILTKHSTIRCTFWVSMFYPILFLNEEGEIVAVIEHFSMERYCSMREIMRLDVEEGAVVKAETLLSDNNYADHALLLMEETLVSLN